MVEALAADQLASFLAGTAKAGGFLYKSPFLQRIVKSAYYDRKLCIVGSRYTGKSRLYDYLKRMNFNVDVETLATTSPRTTNRLNIGQHVFSKVVDFGGDESLNDLWFDFINTRLPFAIIMVVDLTGLIDDTGEFNPEAANSTRIHIRSGEISVSARDRMQEHILSFKALADSITKAFPAYLKAPRRRSLNGILVLLNKWDRWTVNDYQRDGLNAANFVQAINAEVPRLSDFSQIYDFDVVWKPVSFRAESRETVKLALEQFGDHLMQSTSR